MKHDISKAKQKIMPSYSEIGGELNRLDKLERELHLKQLQINNLLGITQAINNNVPSVELYKMFSSFLNWELGVKKMALFVPNDEKVWECASFFGFDEQLLNFDISEQLKKYVRLNSLTDLEHPIISQFDVVIPVLHKNTPIAYAFIGGYEQRDDQYSRIQFITTITNIIAVAIENKRLFKKQIEQERLNREIELASEMQRLLVPTKLPKGNYFEVDSIYKPHLSIGGDYYDFIKINDEKFLFCVADIAGKGVAAALLMSNFQANLHSLVQRGFDSLGSLTAELNKAVYRITEGDRFITFFIGEYDRSLCKLSYVNAGHIQPILLKNDMIQYLDKGCTILGFFEELPNVEIGVEKIEENCLIFTFTDGLTDILNDKEEEFDDQLIASFVLESKNLSPKDFNRDLIKKIKQFKGSKDYTDDFTVLTCKISC